MANNGNKRYELEKTTIAWRDSLRREMKSRRNNMSGSETEELSKIICQRLEKLQPLAQAEVIMGYSSIRNEVNLIPWLQKLKQQGRTILLPRVQENRLVAVELKDEEDMDQSSFGIREPRGEPFDEDQVDVVLVPGLVFDVQGYRLGYGKGYYDRFLPIVGKHCFNCGVCYEYQVVDNVFPHSGDVPVHWIITERSEIAVDWNFF